MRILFLGNNWTGWQVLKWLTKNNAQIIGLVLHPSEKQKYGKEIIKTAEVDPSHIFFEFELRKREIIKKIMNLKPDIGLSVFYGYLLEPVFIDIFPKGLINLHPAYLPCNRGSNPNVWSIIDGTPAGVTMHYIDEGVDTGDIITQHQVPVEPVDTGESLYQKLEKASVDIFKKTWPKIKSGHIPRILQSKNEGTYHSKKDIEKIDCIELDREYTDFLCQAFRY